MCAFVVGTAFGEIVFGTWSFLWGFVRTKPKCPIETQTLLSCPSFLPDVTRGQLYPAAKIRGWQRKDIVIAMKFLSGREVGS